MSVGPESEIYPLFLLVLMRMVIFFEALK